MVAVLCRPSPYKHAHCTDRDQCARKYRYNRGEPRPPRRATTTTTTTIKTKMSGRTDGDEESVGGGETYVRARESRERG